MQKKLRIRSRFKFAKIMRITSLVAALTFTITLVSASNPSFGQAELENKTKVSFPGIPLSKALEELQIKTGIPLAYRSSQLPGDARVTYNGNKKVRDILKDILTPHALFYEVKDGFVVLKEIPRNTDVKTLYAQSNVEVRGTVRDSTGNVMAGVSVSLKDRPSIGTTTDLNGRYILSVPPHSVLVFASLGYKPHEQSIGNRQVIDVTLTPTESGIDEVVVVGFGTQKKISVVGAQSSVNPSELQVPAANLTNVLAGRLAGVVAVQRSGEPGFDNSDVFIRGISTFSQGLSRPLVLVDGVPRDMANIDPEDIENFTILKDAAATAVYGVRGANGVVLITTKKGTAGKPKFGFRYYDGLTTFTQMPEFADGATFMRMSNEALTNRGAAPIYSDDVIRMTAEGTDPYLYPNVDWTAATFNKWGYQRRGNMNINGGSDRTNYYVGVSYLDELGLYKQGDADYDNRSRRSRYNLSSNLTVQASNTTKVELGINGHLLNINIPGTTQDNIVEGLWYMTPVVHPVMYEDGKIADQRSGSLQNPYALITQTGYANQWRNQLFSNLRATQELPFITDGLSATAMFSFDVYNYTSMRRTRRPDTFIATGRDTDGSMLYEETYRGDRFLSFNRSSEGTRTIYWEGALNYNKSFGKHDVTGMLLYNQSDELNSQAGDLTASLPYRFLGLAGRATYGYDNRYFIDANFGYNGSENFAPDHRFGFFPSGGVAWVLSEEPFFEPLKDAVNLFKLRFSHGKVGNSQITGRRFAYLSTISTSSSGGYLFGRDRGNDAFLRSHNIGDYGVNVTWETATKSNLGLDLQVLNNALNVQLDFFKERREGIFLQRGAVPAYLGLQTLPLGNLGVIDNKGFDANVTFNRQFNELRLQLVGNVTYNRNLIVENDQPTPMYPWLDRRGRKVGQRFGFVATGLFENQEEIENGPLHPGTVRPGDIRFQDVNGDGIIDDFDKIPYGYGTIPEWVYGAGFTIGYKALSLSTLFQGVGNVDIRMNGEGLMPFQHGLNRGNLLNNIEDRWTIENPRQDAFYPRLSDGNPNNNFVESNWWVKNGRYVRLKTLQLTYTLPRTWVKRAKIDNANIFFAGYNLVTWSPFKFWDVELPEGRGTKYPLTASYTLGFTLDF
ncbi:SusC/RagA family TonB-linked outer membrane protein [Sphingobacterium haloxyli]|uniref:SusC/RagA family TonB-linked outer membrane protein n=2 Tax=Sphingobacterium haloxyli TaxID=2100533 RepID=A0A2S9J4G7_9SPHI|nr:SusC/RagA family TonB-linked outer membrane protein [Sphingobacterium haloxyli]